MRKDKVNGTVQKRCTVRKENFKKIALGGLEQPRLDKNLLYQHNELNELTKEGPLSYVLRVSPFASISTVSMGQRVPPRVPFQK